MERALLNLLIDSGVKAIAEVADKYGRERLYQDSMTDTTEIVEILNKRSGQPSSGLTQSAALARTLATTCHDYCSKTGHPPEVYYGVIVRLAASLYPGGVEPQGESDEQQGHSRATERPH